MKKIYLFLCLLTSYYFTNAQAGSIDPSFGVNGIQTTGIKINFFRENGVKTLRLNDGALLLVFNTSNRGPVRTVVAKYLSTGTIDSSYGENGYSFPLGTNATDAALQDDGKIVVVGGSLVARYNTDGSIDKTFSTTGTKTININGSVNADGVVIYNNEIYVTGYRAIFTNDPKYGGTTNNDIFISRFSPDGSSHSTTADCSSDDRAHKLTIIGDKIVVAGSISVTAAPASGAPLQFALFGYNLDLSPDKSFGVNGVVTTKFSSDFYAEATAIVAEKNKLLAAGYSGASRYDVFVGRYNINGSLDSTFSDDGKASTRLHSYNPYITIQGDKILTAAKTDNGFAVEQMNNDGSIDNSFGTNGIINFNTPRANVASINMAGTNIITSGTSSDAPDYAIGNFNLDGSANTTFSKDGYIVGYYPSSELSFKKVATQKDGKIVVIGSAPTEVTGADFLVVRYNPDGTLDKSFGQNGVITTGFGVYSSDVTNAICFQGDKIIVAGGTSGAYSSQVNGAIARYNSDGSLDNTFGIGGKVVTDFSFQINSVAVTANGDKIIIGGKTTSFGPTANFAVAGYKSDGSIDKTFGNGGIQTIDFGSEFQFEDAAYSVAVQDQKIVVLGHNYVYNWVIVRFNDNGSLDNTFATNGKLTINFGPNTNIYKSTFAVQGGKIIVAGYGYIDNQLGLIFLRYNADGSLDNTFPGNGKVTRNFPAEARPNEAFHFDDGLFYIQDNGKFLLSGNVNLPGDTRFVIARYNPDNSPDSSFGQNGIQTTRTEGKVFNFTDLTVFGKRLYAVGSAAIRGETETEGAIAAFKLEEPVICTATGSILREYWANVTGTLISDIPVTTTPSSTSQLNSFEAPTDIADNYAQRIRGYICAPATGNYTFYISGDDESELWLSTSDNPADKRKIASVGGMQWTNPREWTKFESQKSITIFLQANTKYYIEALNKEGAGGDNLAVGWITPGTSGIVVIPGSALSPFTGTDNPPVVCTATGTILREYWANVTGTLISDIPVNTAPSSTSQLNSFEAPTDIADNYVQRIRGYICAPATGNYTFYVSGDDESELWLSTGDNPADKRKIASVGGMQWTNPREWNKYESQKSVTIFLQANTKYYIEALNKEGAGGDNLAVGWITPGTSDIAVIPGTVLSPFTETTNNPPVVCTTTGTILREYWANVSGTLISDIPVNTTPSSTSQLNSFEAPTDIADNYGQRIRGYICAPATGNYTFYISGDDESALWLSTSDNPADKRKIAFVGGMQWSGPREWAKYESQKSITIFLQVNTKYYIEELNKEGAGGDKLAVGWITPGSANIAVIPGSVLSPFTGTTSPPVVCSATGSILREYWENVPGTLISDIPVNTAPSSTSQLNSFEAPTDVADNYGQRIRGYICAPATGNYTFYISGDDESELWLSTSDNSADKRKIAFVGGMQWTGPKEWAKYETQKSITIFLQANTKYYIEALNKEGAGGDNLAIGWITPGSSDIVVIPGSVLSPFTGTTSQPLIVAVESQKISESYFDKVSLAVKALPNPTSTHFTINIKSSKPEPVDLKVLDAVGRVIETKRMVSAKGSVTIGDRYRIGIYYLQAVQGSERATLKLIKGAF